VGVGAGVRVQGGSGVRARVRRRSVRRVRAIRMRLGGSPSLTDPFSEKTNGMHWRARATGFTAKPRGANACLRPDWKVG
jgi:hypothetical protein